MNPNDLADMSDSTSDTVIRRTVVSNDGHRILVVGTIPEQGVPSVGIHVDAIKIEGGLDTMVALEDALGDVLVEMEDAMVASPVPCECGEEHPRLVEDDDGIIRCFVVVCPRCGRHTDRWTSRTDATRAWSGGRLG